MAEEFMPIRMPFHKRFQDVRCRLVPMLVFVLCVFAAVWMWPRTVMLPNTTGAGIAVSPAQTGANSDSAIRPGGTRRPADYSRRPTGFGGTFHIFLEGRSAAGAPHE